MGPGRLGLTDREITVLIGGGHTLGFAHVDASGHKGAWDLTPTVFDNEFFKSLNNFQWTQTKNFNGQFERQAVDPKSGKVVTLMMLPADIALKKQTLSSSSADQTTRRYLGDYAADQNRFFTDFVNAWVKVQELGGSTQFIPFLLLDVCEDTDLSPACVFTRPNVAALVKPVFAPRDISGYYGSTPKAFTPNPVPSPRSPLPPNPPRPKPTPTPRPIPTPTPRPTPSPRTTGDVRLTTTQSSIFISTGTGTPSTRPLSQVSTTGKGTTTFEITSAPGIPAFPQPEPAPQPKQPVPETTGQPPSPEPAPQPQPKQPEPQPQPKQPEPQPAPQPDSPLPELPLTGPNNPIAGPAQMNIPLPPEVDIPIDTEAPLAPVAVGVRKEEPDVKDPEVPVNKGDDEPDALPDILPKVSGNSGNREEDQSSTGGSGSGPQPWIWALVAVGVIALVAVVVIAVVIRRRSSRSKMETV